MKIKPIDERVLVQPVEKEAKTVGGIIIPDMAGKERPQMGRIIAMGDDVEVADRKQKKMSELLKVGDTVVYARYGGTEVKIEDAEHLLISRSDILAVVEE